MSWLPWLRSTTFQSMVDRPEEMRNESRRRKKSPNRSLRMRWIDEEGRKLTLESRSWDRKNERMTRLPTVL